MRAALAALACVTLATGVSAAAGAELPSAFDRAPTARDELPLPASQWPRRGAPYDSRRIATLTGTKHRWALYVFRQRGRNAFKPRAPARVNVCVGVFTYSARTGGWGAGYGCSPPEKFFADGRDVEATQTGRVFAGVVTDRVARVAVIGSLGTVHKVRLTPDEGFIFNCRAYNGCACVVSRLQAFDRNGRRIENQDWRSSARNCRR